MRALARSAGRAPAVIAFLLLSLAAHLAVLRGASVSGWFSPSVPAAAPVTVSLIEFAPPPTLAPPAAEAKASPPPRPKPRPRTRPRPAPRAAPEAAPAATAEASASAPAAAFDADSFWAPIVPASSAQEGEAATVDASPAGREAEAAPARQAEPGAAPPAAEAAAAPTPEPPIVVAPQSGSVRYRVHYGDPADGNVVATLEQSFDIGADRYRLHSEGRAKGLIAWFYRGSLVQDSVGTVSAQGLAPSSYREQRGDRPPRSAAIDVARGEVVFGSGVKREAPPGVQDRLSAAVQLALMRQSRPALFEAGATIRLPMLGSSSVESVGWRVLGEEPVTTDAGVVQAVRLSRTGSSEDDPAIDVWLALDARIVPVRMRITEPSGRALDQVLATQ
ncbi:MAG: DUF3108 domain-containing protein [Burkholderiaceae bacterium]|nr:DUF3108 domain-containing protein [Burkholderiaceae bacterium]